MSLLDAFSPDKTFKITSRTAVGGFAGGFTESESPSVPCMVQVESAHDRYLNQRDGQSVTLLLICAGDTDVKKGDTITYDEKTWRVLAVVDPLQDGDHLEVTVELEQ
jgi:hypothetical protein